MIDIFKIDAIEKFSDTTNALINHWAEGNADSSMIFIDRIHQVMQDERDDGLLIDSILFHEDDTPIEGSEVQKEANNIELVREEINTRCKVLLQVRQQSMASKIDWILEMQIFRWRYEYETKEDYELFKSSWIRYCRRTLEKMTWHQLQKFKPGLKMFPLQSSCGHAHWGYEPEETFVDQDATQVFDFSDARGQTAT